MNTLTVGLKLARILALSVLVATATSALASEDDWYPSKHGPEDTLGAANILSPEKVLEAAKLITTGKTYAMGVVLGRETPAYGSRSFQLFAIGHGDGAGGVLGENLATANDDWMGIGSQLDGIPNSHLMKGRLK